MAGSMSTRILARRPGRVSPPPVAGISRDRSAAVPGPGPCSPSRKKRSGGPACRPRRAPYLDAATALGALKGRWFSRAVLARDAGYAFAERPERHDGPPLVNGFRVTEIARKPAFLPAGHLSAVFLRFLFGPAAPGRSGRQARPAWPRRAWPLASTGPGTCAGTPGPGQHAAPAARPRAPRPPGHRPAWPAHLSYEVTQPGEILCVNRRQRRGVRLRLAPRSLIFLRAAQQLGAQFLLHEQIILFEARTGNASPVGNLLGDCRRVQAVRRLLL